MLRKIQFILLAIWASSLYTPVVAAPPACLITATDSLAGSVPHLLARDEFLNLVPPEMGDHRLISPENPDLHRYFVTEAMEEGLSVPRHVLRQYPDLLIPRSLTAFVDATAEAFKRAVDLLGPSSTLDSHDQAYYQQALDAGGQLRLSEDGEIGYGITADGMLFSFFNRSNRSGAGFWGMRDALHRGATQLECYEGNLPSYYARFGFRVEKVVEKVNDELGTRDVFLMKYHGGSVPDLFARKIGTFPRGWAELPTP